MSCSALERTASKLLGGRVAVSLKPIVGGRNNRIYCVETGNGLQLALKHYPRSHGDPRDRLDTEFRALSFLSQRGVVTVPQPVGRDDEAAVALYEWIDGQRPDATPEAIDHMAEFCRCLHGLREFARTEGLPDAAEACTAGAEILRQIRRRLDRLLAVEGEPDLHCFLKEEVRPVLDVTAADSEELSPELRTLSPSDFGLHNMLMRGDRPVFVDFEYFGWDDPVKLVCDVAWHPGMELSPPLASRFISRVWPVYQDGDPSFEARLRSHFPLYGLRWVMILLNEFLPERWAVRVHAGAVEQASVKRIQLDKARRWMERVERVIRDRKQMMPTNLETFYSRVFERNEATDQ